MRPINIDFFKNPTTDPDFSVSGFWFWNDHINDEVLSEQLGMMKRICANQPIIHARKGLVNEYLSDDWFTRIRFTIEECRKNRQKCWIYDEKDWPSGNCNWSITRNEKYREHFLQFELIKTNKNESFTWEKNYLSGKAFLKNGIVENINISKKTASFSEDAELIFVSIEVDPYEKVGKLNIDYLSNEAIQTFIKSTHEKYKSRFNKDFGEIITGTFMDETRFCNPFPWTEKFNDEFKKRKGYDIIPLLPLLFRVAEKSDILRFDYYDVVSDLYAENTYKQIYNWCEDNKLKSTGHVLGEETIAAQSYFGADTMRVFRYLHVPGIDHLGNGIGSLDAKFVSSAAHHYGKDRISCEAFGAAGWDMDYEDMVRISNWLFQQGINLIIMHGFYYSILNERAEDFPPSYFFQWKYWDKMKEYVFMANRMMEMLSGGYVEAEILVYSPMETFWTCFEPDTSIKTFFPKPGTPLAKHGIYQPPPIKDKKAKFIDNQFQLICSRLADENLDYEIIGADAVPCFIVKNGQLVNKNTGSSYSVLILPCVKVLTEEMVNLISDFTLHGGLVISYYNETYLTVAKDGSHMRKKLPTVDQSGIKKAQKIADIVRLCREKINPSFEIVLGPDIMAHSQASYPDYLIDPYVHDDERVYGIGVCRYIKADARIFNFTNYNEKNEELRIWLESERIPSIFNPETGKIKTVENSISRDGGFEFELTIAANRAIFVVCERSPHNHE